MRETHLAVGIDYNVFALFVVRAQVPRLGLGVEFVDYVRWGVAEDSEELVGGFGARGGFTAYG